MKESLPNIDLNGIANYLSEQPDVVAAYLFGSLARGHGTRLSDVDIAVLFPPGISAQRSVERQLELMVALDEFVDREVQVTLLDRAPPFLTYQVIKEGVLLYERDRSERVDFQVRTLRTYFDLKPMLEFHRQAVMKQIEEGGLGRRPGDHTGTVKAAQQLHQRLAQTPRR